MIFLIVKSGCFMEDCSSSQDQHIKRIFDQRFLFCRRVQAECGCRWANRQTELSRWCKIRLTAEFCSKQRGSDHLENAKLLNHVTTEEVRYVRL